MGIFYPPKNAFLKMFTLHRELNAAKAPDKVCFTPHGTVYHRLGCASTLRKVPPMRWGSVKIAWLKDSCTEGNRSEMSWRSGMAIHVWLPQAPWVELKQVNAWGFLQAKLTGPGCVAWSALRGGLRATRTASRKFAFADWSVRDPSTSAIKWFRPLLPFDLVSWCACDFDL